MPEKKLIVCDVCDTLYASNTTFDFIRYFVAQQNKFQRLWFTLISARYSPLFYLLILAGKIFRADLVRTLAIKLLGGLSKETLTILAFEFHDSFLEKRKNEKVFSLLEKLKKDGEILLLSSSIDPVINAIASRNGFQYKSSSLEYEKGLSSGKLQDDLTGVKHTFLVDLVKDHRQLAVVTDNRSDYELVKMADERYVVLVSPKQEKFWEKLKPNFIKP